MQTLSEPIGVLYDPDSFKLTEKQKEALTLMATPAIYILLYGGSRSTKTFTILRSIVWRALKVNGSRHCVLRLRFNHVKSSIVLDTFPKMMALCFPDCPHHLDKSDWYVKFPNGSEIWFGGLDDKDRTEKILGKEYATIFVNEVSQISYNSFLILITRLAQVCHYMKDGIKRQLRLRMFLDENPPNKGHWTYKLCINKYDPENKRKVDDPKDYASLQMNPVDNRENLDPIYLKNLDKMPKSKRDRFYLGKFADNDDNALWTAEMIEANRVNSIPDGVSLIRVVVPVDPSGASDDENQNNDEIGIGVMSLGSDGIAYVQEDLTVLAGPKKWGGVVASAYNRHGADRVVGESNYGGAMVEFVVKTADPNISYKGVTASRGKVVRAEPISALTDSGKIKFVGRFDLLEDELCGFTTTGYIGERSPNRADWFIWGATELFPGLTAKPKEPERMLNIPNIQRL